VGVVFIILSIGTTILMSLIQRQLLLDFYKQGLQILADEKAAQVNNFLEFQKEKQKIITTMNVFKEALKDPNNKTKIELVREEIKEKTRQIFENFSANCQPFRIVNVGGNDAQGKPVMSEQYFTPNFDDAGKFIGYRVLGWVIKNS